MRLIKCPRCELNYITPEEGYCKICKREMKGESQQEEVELCTVCNEHPALPGKDVCLFCLKEMNADSDDRDTEETEAPVDESSLGGIDPVSAMDEIIPDIPEDIHDREYTQIENEMSLEELEEEEADEDDDLEDED